MSLIKIDEIGMPDHSYLDATDDCYYFYEYTAQKGHNYSKGNDLVNNFKKHPKYRGGPAWRYKLLAIKEVSGLLTNFLPTVLDAPEQTTIIPIPPSKMPDHEEFDDRVSVTLRNPNFKLDSDINDAISIRENMDAFHERPGRRPTPNQLMEMLQLDEDFCANSHNTIVIFDDVLTTGSHFKACKNLILQRCPDKRVVGVFIARRAIESILDN